MFDPNSTFLFILAGLVILFVIAQSVFFLVRAYRRGKALGMDMKQIRKTILSTAVFTFAPAVSILLGVITLSKFLIIRDDYRSSGLYCDCVGHDTGDFSGADMGAAFY